MKLAPFVSHNVLKSLRTAWLKASSNLVYTITKSSLHRSYQSKFQPSLVQIIINSELYSAFKAGRDLRDLQVRSTVMRFSWLLHLKYIPYV